MSRVVLVPGVLALLPEYAGLIDPVADLRAACREAVAWLAEAGEVTVVADEQGRRVAEALAPTPSGGGGKNYLVVANGSARRGEKAPGHLDPRAHGFDRALGAALRSGDTATLATLDTALADELLVGNPAGLRTLATLIEPGKEAIVDYDDDPFGVQYWVMRWTCGS